MDNRLILRNDDTYVTYNGRLISLTPDDVNKLTLDALLYIYNTKYYLCIKTYDISSNKNNTMDNIFIILKNDNAPPLEKDFVKSLYPLFLVTTVLKVIDDETFIKLLTKIKLICSEAERINKITKHINPMQETNTVRFINASMIEQIKLSGLFPEINDITKNIIDTALLKCVETLLDRTSYNINTYNHEYFVWRYKKYGNDATIRFFNNIINNATIRTPCVTKRNLLYAVKPTGLPDLNDDEIFNKMTVKKFDEIFTDINPFLSLVNDSTRSITGMSNLNSEGKFTESNVIIKFINFTKPAYIKDRTIYFNVCKEKDFKNFTNYEIFFSFSHPTMELFTHEILLYIMNKYKRERNIEHDKFIDLLDYFIFIKTRSQIEVKRIYDVEKINEITNPILIFVLSLIIIEDFTNEQFTAISNDLLQYICPAYFEKISASKLNALGDKINFLKPDQLNFIKAAVIVKLDDKIHDILFNKTNIPTRIISVIQLVRKYSKDVDKIDDEDMTIYYELLINFILKDNQIKKITPSQFGKIPKNKWEQFDINKLPEDVQSMINLYLDANKAVDVKRAADARKAAVITLSNLKEYNENDSKKLVIKDFEVLSYYEIKDFINYCVKKKFNIDVIPQLNKIIESIDNAEKIIKADANCDLLKVDNLKKWSYQQLSKLYLYVIPKDYIASCSGGITATFNKVCVKKMSKEIFEHFSNYYSKTIIYNICYDLSDFIKKSKNMCAVWYNLQLTYQGNYYTEKEKSVKDAIFDSFCIIYHVIYDPSKNAYIVDLDNKNTSNYVAHGAPISFPYQIVKSHDLFESAMNIQTIELSNGQDKLTKIPVKFISARVFNVSTLHIHQFCPHITMLYTIDTTKPYALELPDKYACVTEGEIKAPSEPDEKGKKDENYENFIGKYISKYKSVEDYMLIHKVSEGVAKAALELQYEFCKGMLYDLTND